MNVIPNRIRREIDNETMVSEINDWVEDLKALQEVLHDMKRNPQSRAFSQENLDDVVEAADLKLKQLGEVAKHYKHALYASVITPDEELNLQQLGGVIKMIDEVNQEKYTLPLFNKVIHAVNGLRVGQVQNMLIIQSLRETKEDLMYELGRNTIVGPMEQRRLQKLQEQVTQVHDGLLRALKNAGYKTSAEVEDLENLEELVSLTIRSIEESTKMAEEALKLVESTPGFSRELFIELRNVLKNEEQEEVEEDEETRENMTQSGTQTTEKSKCMKNPKLEYNSQGQVISINGELALRKLGTLVVSKNYSYDYRGDCVMPLTQEQKSRIKRSTIKAPINPLIIQTLRESINAFRMLTNTSDCFYYVQCCTRMIEYGRNWKVHN